MTGTAGAVATRAEQRADRVRAGLAELDVWLSDQARGGLAGLQRGEGLGKVMGQPIRRGRKVTLGRPL